MIPTPSMFARVALCATLALTTACKSTTGAGGAQDTVGSAERLSAGIEQLDSTIVKMAEEIDNLRASVSTEESVDGSAVALVDLTTVYGTFMGAAESVLMNIEQVQNETKNLDSSFKKYMKAWERETKKLSNPTLQGVALQRQNKARMNFTNLANDLNSFLEAVNAYSAELSESVNYVGADLTPAGIDAIDSVLAGLVDKGETLRTRIPDNRDAVDAYSQSLRASTPTAPKPASTTGG